MAVIVIHKHNAKKAGLHYDFRFPYNGSAMSIVLKDEPSEFLKNNYTVDTAYTIEDKNVLRIEHKEITEGYGAGVIDLVEKFKGNIKKDDKKIDIVSKEKNLKFTILIFSDTICRFIVNSINKDNSEEIEETEDE